MKDGGNHCGGGKSVIYQEPRLVIPPCLRRVYETAVEFTRSRKRDYKGLLLLVGDREKISSITSRRLNGPLTSKYIGDNPLLYSDRVFDLYREMGEMDGGTAFDYEGNLLGTEVVVQRVCEKGLLNVMGEVMRRKGGNGNVASTRHLAAAFASKNGVPSVAVSGEVGTVMAFQGGRLVEELYFDPRIMTGYENRGEVL